MPPKKTYTKKDPIEHILLRSSMYVGSKTLKTYEDFIAEFDNESEEYKIFKKFITASPAILRIFIEVLSNAVDNVDRSRKAKIPCTTIKVNINKETGETTVWNDGDIIPIEMHSEEKMYNHTLIFGHLLTGSNYDDDQDREISGLNGLGAKCLLWNTMIPCFDGSIKIIENIEIGDIIIGDDGKQRKVLDKISGFGEMYEIIQSRGESYIVNSEHILSLRMPDHKVIFWNNDGWSMLYLDSINKIIKSKKIKAIDNSIECKECGIFLNSNLKRHYKRKHPNIKVPKTLRKIPTVEPPSCDNVRNKYIEMQLFAKKITDDNTIDISIKDYMELNDTIKGRLSGYKSDCVQWGRKEVYLDPYVLGLWLGDGGQNGYKFAINAEDDIEILNYLIKWGEENDAMFKNIPFCSSCKENKYDPNFIPCKSCAAFSISSKNNYGKMNKAPLKILLKKYNLLEEKHIPKDYLINDRDTRLKVLAGLIDSDGYVNKEREGRRITIAQGMMHEKLANDILYLSRSLGFSSSKIIRNVTWNYKNEKRTGKCIIINITGNGLEDIPVILPRKKCSAPLRREVLNTGPIKIKKVEDSKFVGLRIDGNERFILNDFTVTHNCSNVFSSKFVVKGLDPNNKKTFEQTWTNNMRSPEKPVVKSTTLKQGYTEVKYFPDFKQFGIEGYTDDIIGLYLKYVIDAAMLTKVKVYFNNDLINVNNLLSYSNLYSKENEEERLNIKYENVEVVVTSSTEFQHISFTNGIYNRLGGQHVESVCEALFRPLVEKFTKKGKPSLNIKDIKQFFKVFVNCVVVNPEFDSQNKEKLESPKVKFEIKPNDIKKILKWSIVGDIEDMLKAKEMVVLKKTEKKKKGYVKIEGYDPANNAGGKNSNECGLILCEGLSAKTYAVAGIKKGIDGKSGRDWWGILPLSGKLLNCRNAAPTMIAKNKVITDLIQSLGVKVDTDYTDEKNFKTLNYGKVILLTDADSVTYDTPCMLKNIETEEIEIKPICELNSDIWIEDHITLKQYSISNKYLIWTDKGWTKIRSIMRHKVSKPIFRVLTHTGCVDVTEDHSLLNKNADSITVNDCIENETELLHNKYIQEKFIIDIDEDYAYALGYFQADGCCVTDSKVSQKRKDGTINSKWCIDCVEIEPLEKLKLIFEKYEDTNVNKDSNALKKHINNKTPCNEVKLSFNIRKISFSAKSGREYKYSLEAVGVRKNICNKYRNMFYNSLREKQIPKEILNSSIETQKAFLNGFYAGDRNKGDNRTTDTFDGEYKSQIMGLFQLLQNCGYKPSLNCDNNKLNVYKILMSKYYDKPEYTVKKIINVSKKYKDTYVYDLETDNHHFHASIGNMIVHNTD